MTAHRHADDRDTTAVIVDLLARLTDDQIAGATADLRRLPSALHRAVLLETHTRADVDRAECEALGAGDGL